MFTVIVIRNLGDATKQYGYAPAAYGPAYGTNGSEARVFEERVAFPMMAPQTDDKHHMRWRDPNLAEVIGFLSNSNNVIKANAAAYLQHLCYMDDPNKQKTRSLGGIPPLVKLLTNESPDVCRNACGALRYDYISTISSFIHSQYCMHPTFFEYWPS